MNVEESQARKFDLPSELLMVEKERLQGNKGYSVEEVVSMMMEAIEKISK